jgi:hypothetical protein
MTGTQVVGLPAEQGCYGSTRLPWDCQDVFHGCELCCGEFQNTQEIWNVWGCVTVQNGRNRCIKHSKYAEGRLQIYVSSSHVHPAVTGLSRKPLTAQETAPVLRFELFKFQGHTRKPFSMDCRRPLGGCVKIWCGKMTALHWLWKPLVDLAIALQSFIWSDLGISIASFEIIELWIWCLSSWKSTMKWSLGSCVVHNQGVDQNLLCFWGGK